MPLKVKRKDGKGYKYRSYGQLVGDFKRQGMSESKARAIVAGINRKQHGKKKKG